jgi:hypothetical protein
MSNENEQQINAEAEEWITVVDPKTMTPRRVRRAEYSINEVYPGGPTYAQPKRPLNEG